MKHFVLLALLICWVLLFGFSSNESIDHGTFRKYESKMPTPERALASDDYLKKN